MKSKTEFMTSEKQEVYTLGQIMYVPDYRTAGLFVGPGESITKPRPYTAIELKAAGAVKSYAFLWPRNLNGEKNASV